ncbi:MULTISPECIES: 6-pyruvoyl trahydropterin synthase family protein [Marinobacter]|jgi:6-pyruvoyl-tetrahydropterin synthase|uniref:6-carboxy-5,6,7,8-tetrahydropterin synthase n=1 Tax=Marinobacter salarius TaxID=1420917 RepID=W5Z0Z0_9GAMM|nr:MULTISPECIES: 6-carboxytetrahydropterin synthase [Marinobacter]AHI32158.1 6-pyruvoyl tetrahydropterin synthase [Marinobacter salarius]ARM84006.1 6-pyruvoyl tetrahydropterin synthase [Marinobacter salarius]AZR42772.1 6-pyruvoyltetrahydropterin synthase [Marinobacter salarius]KXJ47270.1 MAG: 6-pyruvoyl tetrahydropterin synthase [Marinobacter sp. Hex_13]MAB50808.1 6-carboxytetrahydropterin synthase [Marinobacter sp.]|tara:strand:+ start:571 stop:969 length:399 start_codon:yes stop_codon:yes gene_type:complete
MFSLTVRDHMMIAHSFKGDIFGPAQGLHGATYVVDVSFEREALDNDDLIVDIGLASEVLSSVIAEFNMKNLDDIEEFANRNTTTEFMAMTVFDRLAAAIRQGRLGETGKGLCSMKVTLGESHIAWASYHGEL